MHTFPVNVLGGLRKKCWGGAFFETIFVLELSIRIQC